MVSSASKLPTTSGAFNAFTKCCAACSVTFSASAVWIGIGREQCRRPIPIQTAEAEKVTEQAAQHFVNALNAPDVVGSLLADETIDMAALQLIPRRQLGATEELVETAH